MFYKEFEVNGKMKRLKYDFNAIADIEELSGMGLAKLFSAEVLGLHTVRLLMWAGLKHEDHGITIQRAGLIIRDMMEEGHDFDSVLMLVIEALSKCGVFPENTFDGIKDMVNEGKEENPTMPENSERSPKKSKN